MAKKVILAVAGAGKTYHICHAIDPEKKNLILAYTHENIHNIQKELCDAHGCVPDLTTVMTFHAFVYHHLILPYEPSIREHFKLPRFSSKGICMTEPPQAIVPDASGQMVYNKNYRKKENIMHYITKRGQYYCDRISELALYVKDGKDTLIKRAANRLNMFYDAILIDEFQDFRENDYEVIMALAKQLNEVVLVGDYYQHSVSAKNNSGKPFKSKKGEIGYDDFVAEITKMGFEVDTTTLAKSRRCSANICDYVSQKLGISIASTGDHDGSVIWVEENATSILNDNSITKLVFQEATNYTFSALNWSYSKGDTVDSACVILTDGLNNLDNDKFNPKKLKTSTLNKLYVAMTRSRGDLYLMKASTFKAIKDAYITH